MKATRTRIRCVHCGGEVLQRRHPGGHGYLFQCKKCKREPARSQVERAHGARRRPKNEGERDQATAAPRRRRRGNQAPAMKAVHGSTRCVHCGGEVIRGRHPYKDTYFLVCKGCGRDPTDVQVETPDVQEGGPDPDSAALDRLLSMLEPQEIRELESICCRQDEAALRAFLQKVAPRLASPSRDDAPGTGNGESTQANLAAGLIPLPLIVSAVVAANLGPPVVRWVKEKWRSICGG